MKKKLPNHNGSVAPENLKRYIYIHVDPRSKQTVYVGKGTGGRAWDCAFTSRGDKQHVAWMVQLLEESYTPQDFVVIVAQGLSEIDAKRLEVEWIEKLKSSNPLFNHCYGRRLPRSLSLEQIQKAKVLQEQGISFQKIAKTLGSSTQTVWRALTRKESMCYQEGGVLCV